MNGERKRYTQEDLIPGVRDEKGLVCPQCGCRHFYRVVDTAPQVNRIYRKRVCRNCGFSFRTIETVIGGGANGKT